MRLQPNIAGILMPADETACFRLLDEQGGASYQNIQADQILHRVQNAAVMGNPVQNWQHVMRIVAPGACQPSASGSRRPQVRPVSRRPHQRKKYQLARQIRHEQRHLFALASVAFPFLDPIMHVHIFARTLPEGVAKGKGFAHPSQSD